MAAVLDGARLVRLALPSILVVVLSCNIYTVRPQFREEVLGRFRLIFEILIFRSTHGLTRDDRSDGSV